MKESLSGGFGIRFSLGVFAACLVLVCAAGEEKPALTAQDLPAIVKALDDPSQDARTKAESQLDALAINQGEGIRAALEAAAPTAGKLGKAALEEQLKHIKKIGEYEELFKWLDGLMPAELKDCKFVRVATGQWSQSGNDPRRNSYLTGFLLKSEPGKFTVYTRDFRRTEFKPTVDKAQPYEKIGFEALDLQQYAAGALNELRHPPKEEDHWRRFGESISERAEVVNLARGCASQGLKKLAYDLCAHADGMLQRNGRVNDERLFSLRELVAKDIAHSIFWRFVLKYGDSTVSRAQLLEECRTFVTQFPESEHIKRAKEERDLLEKMIEEDAAHAKDLKPWGKMTPHERIAELIFQLRDQNGAQWSQPGSCDVFADPRGEKSPAHQLVKIGVDAVPALMDELDNNYFTRSVGYHRDFYFSHYVLRVGDCAEAVIERIAGRSFYQGRTTSSAMLKDGEGQTTKHVIQAWWADYQKKGEKTMLVEAVSAGDRGAYEQAGKLVEKYPDVALDAIKSGLQKVKPDENWVRGTLIRAAGEIKGDGPATFLLELLKSAPTQDDRVMAAYGLFKRNRAEAVPAMIADWNGSRQDGGDRLADDGEAIVHFLARCNKAEAIEALRANLRRRGINTRMAIIDAMDSVLAQAEQEKDKPEPGFEERMPKPSTETVVAVERLLIECLEQTDERKGSSGSGNGKSFSDPRVCDIAGLILSCHFGGRYVFDLEAPLAQRDRERVAAINIWRKAHGQELLPVPAPPKLAVLPKEKAQPALDAFVNAGDDAARGAAQKELEKLGLPALPHVLAAIKALDEKHPARAPLQACAASLGSIVTEIRIAEDSIKLDDGLQKNLDDLQTMLDGLKGKPLTASAWVGLVRQVVNNMPEGAHGIDLIGDREGVGDGIVLTLKLPRTAGHGHGTGGWGIGESVQVGKSNLHNSSGVGSSDHVRSKDAYESLRKALEKALAAPPTEALRLRTDVAEEK